MEEAMTTTNGSPESGDCRHVPETVSYVLEASQGFGPACEESGGSQRAHEVPSQPAQAPSQQGEPNRLEQKIKLLNRFVDETLIGLEPLTALLWVVLYREARNGVAEISHGQLAEIMGVSDRTICRHIEVLIANRLLRKLKTGGYGRGCNRYQLGITSLAKDNPLRHVPRSSAASANAKPGKPKAPRPKS
jgi:hypothetical protein